MKINVLKSDKHSVEFLLEGERHTFPNMLKQKLLEDKNVEFVSYILDHPLDKSARFVLKTKGVSPKKVLEDAAKQVDSDLAEFEKNIKKAFK